MITIYCVCADFLQAYGYLDYLTLYAGILALLINLRKLEVQTKVAQKMETDMSDPV
jgi:hypothetical protein